MMFNKAIDFGGYSLTKAELQSGIRLTARERALQQNQEKPAPLQSGVSAFPKTLARRQEESASREKTPPSGVLPKEQEQLSSPSSISEKSEDQ